LGNIFDYLAWRGDLSFGNAPLCPVDSLILSMLAYMGLEEVVSDDPREEPIRLADVAKRYFLLPRGQGDGNHERLLREMAASVRYGSLRLFAATKVIDRADGIQFGAVSLLLPGQNMFVAFEGTDDTLVGWKEDFRMSYECPVPAQLRAVSYLQSVAAAYPMRRMFVGGHSKGGNLAMYASVFGGEACRYRIRTVYNHDGPGFCDATIHTPEYLELRDRIRTYMPQSSIVAVLLEHDTNYRVVKSTNKGLMQHDPYSWELVGTEFVYAAERTAFGHKTEAIIDGFVNDLSPERKRRFCEALFSVLEASEQDTISGIGGNMKQSLKNIMRAYGDLSDEMRTVLAESIAVLNRSRKRAE